ncbi:MAG: terminase small subunit [Acidocella sp.]|nr:terminase small subunit [Acidocella sp.]MDD2794375.1 terminase small subunit [Acidocella sp.]
MVEVNLDQLSQQLQCSLPTARKLIQDYPDLPVIERGGMGKQWRFDAGAVIAFLQAKRDEELALAAQRNEALAQLTLPISRRDETGAEVSLDDKLKAVKLRAAEREELKESRFLVPTHEVRDALEKAFRRYGQMQNSALDRVCKAHNLPEAVKRVLEREFAEARTAFVRDTTAALATKEDGDEPRSLFG